ncbi:hypothetical protein IID19_04525 [Patescibacteria group bacterium]|nr:hypothetical protein [Patescibacteria group bacterium]
MYKKITFFIVIILLVVPVGVSLAAVPTDRDFNTKAEEMRTAHQAFKDARSQAETPEVANANGNTNTRQGMTKDQIMERREDQRKITLQKVVDLQIAYFERVQSRIDNMPNVSETEKTALTSQVTTAISGLQSIKASIDAATGAEALKNLAKNLRTSFMGYHELVKAIVDSIHASRMVGAENRAGDRASAIDTDLDESDAEGKDVTVLKTELDTAKTIIADAKILREAGQYKEAATKLKEAYTVFRSISQAAKAL